MQGKIPVFCPMNTTLPCFLFNKFVYVPQTLITASPEQEMQPSQRSFCQPSRQHSYCILAESFKRKEQSTTKLQHMDRPKQSQAECTGTPFLSSYRASLICILARH